MQCEVIQQSDVTDRVKEEIFEKFEFLTGEPLTQCFSSHDCHIG